MSGEKEMPRNYTINTERKYISTTKGIKWQHKKGF